MIYRLLVRVLNQQGHPQDTVVAVPSGKTATVKLTSPYLISPGQTLEVQVSITPHRTTPEEGTRELRDILREVIQHQEDHPGHGTNCSCLDPLVQELHRLVLADVPDYPSGDVEYQESWEHIFGIRARVKYVLAAIARRL